MARRRKNYDRQWVIGIAKELVQGQPAPSAAKAGRELTLELSRLDHAGDIRARVALLEMAAHASVQLIGQVLRSSGTIRVAWNGTVVDVAERLAVAVRDDSGSRVAERQYPLWIELSWDEIESLRNAHAHQRDSLSANVAAFNKVLALRVRYPEAHTPLEACEMAGLDPQEIRIDAAK